jgi:hypothetical protein
MINEWNLMYKKVKKKKLKALLSLTIRHGATGEQGGLYPLQKTVKPPRSLPLNICMIIILY